MSNRKKIIIVVSGVDFSMGFLWIARYFDRSDFDIEFVLLNPREPALIAEIRRLGVRADYIKLSGKRSFLSVWLRLFSLFIRRKPHAIHCHLLEAGLLGLSAGMVAGIKNRFYTRHHSTYNSLYFPAMVKFDLIINRWASRIIAISDNVRNVLISDENVSEDKITLIHHGFRFDEFFDGYEERLGLFRKKHDIRDSAFPVIGVISRFVEWKGVQYVVPAFKRLCKEYPDALLVLANTSGNYISQINDLLSELPQEKVRMIAFDEDLFSLYQCFDCFVHVPIDKSVEAFGQVYIEALAAKIPSVFTLSGIASDFIIHEKNALVVPYKNSEAIYESMKRILNDENLRERLIENGYKSVISDFSFERSMNQLQELYGN